MSNKEIENLKKKVKDLEWEIDNAHAYIFNITPYRESEDMVEDLCDQIAILEGRMHPHCIVCNCDRRKPIGHRTCICGVYSKYDVSRMNEEIGKLSEFLMKEFGGPDRNESACEMAIRLLTNYKKILTDISIMKERG